MGTLSGVYPIKRKNGTTYYRSSITVHSKHISLGTYPSETEAHNAYLEACHTISLTKTDITAYHRHCNILPFSKWIILINYMNSGYYFKNPILLKKDYFLYYYSEQEYYKFDVDDLFYYANHKIMKRGGHLFVADYGMQVNILSRYGIKNFAVATKDYFFVNGDSNDFRYKNIKIINRYYGVKMIKRKNSICYKTYIHVNGNFLVGIYDTETEAAIAYNKAVNTLKKKGNRTNYATNYIIEINEITYATIYNKVRISKKLRDL